MRHMPRFALPAAEVDEQSTSEDDDAPDAVAGAESDSGSDSDDDAEVAQADGAVLTAAASDAVSPPHGKQKIKIPLSKSGQTCHVSVNCHSDS